jgi:hypothetical protein
MDVTLKNIEIVNAMQSIGELLLLEDLTTKVNWNLSKNFKKLQSSFKTFSECEQELLKKHALKNEDGSLKTDEDGEAKFAPKMKVEYFEKRSELLNCEDTIDILSIKLSDLPDKIGKGVNLLNLDFMIDDSNN